MSSQTLKKQAKHPQYTFINKDNQFTDIAHHFTQAATKDYANWLQQQACPAKSYLEHPIDSEAQLTRIKADFNTELGCSLGAYIRIKRVHHLLNNTHPPKKTTATNTNVIYFSYMDTPLGLMLALVSHVPKTLNDGDIDESIHTEAVCLLEFIDRKMLETQLKQIADQKHCQFKFITTSLHERLQSQLTEYFSGQRQQFDLAIELMGTEFQKQVWAGLQTIAYGQTLSYAAEAEMLDCPKAVRAVANANGKNKLAIVIPCHRVVRKNGDLGGYGGGIWRKRQLLEMESKVVK